MLETKTTTETGKELKLWLDEENREMKATVKGLTENEKVSERKVKGYKCIDCGTAKHPKTGERVNVVIKLNDDIKDFLKKAKSEIEKLKEKERQQEVVFEVVKTMNSGQTPNWNVLDREEKLLSEEQQEKIWELRSMLGERQLFAGATKHIDAEDLPVEEGEKYTLDEIIKLAEQHSKKWQKAKKAEKEEEEHYQQCLEDAKKIGEKVEFDRYTANCNDPQRECSTDIVTIYITPDGEKVSERTHTY